MEVTWTLEKMKENIMRWLGHVMEARHKGNEENIF